MGIPPYISTLSLALLCDHNDAARDGSSFAAFELVREGVNISELLHAMDMSHKRGIAEMSLRLIEPRADINEHWHVRRLTPLGALEALQSLRYQFGKDTALTRLSYHDGSTPLMTALLLGNYETAMLLLREVAGLDLRNEKFTAADLAQAHKLQEILQGDSV